MIRQCNVFLKDPSNRKHRSDKGKMKAVNGRDIRNIKRQVFKTPGSTSKKDFLKLRSEPDTQNNSKPHSGINCHSEISTEKASDYKKAHAAKG